MFKSQALQQLQMSNHIRIRSTFNVRNLKTKENNKLEHRLISSFDYEALTASNTVISPGVKIR